MVGQTTATATATKPSRSDEVLDSDQQQEIANQVRAQFDSLAPKRPAKPNRSEPDAISPILPSDVNQNIPELDKLRYIESRSPVKFSFDGRSEVGDEFVETEYYKELVSIDKQHHATGTGFIKVENDGGAATGYGIELGGDSVLENRVNGHGIRSNPATNDWVPEVEDDQVFVSSKPNRSEVS